MRATLFAKESRGPIDKLEKKMTGVWDRMEVVGCRSKANRCFCVRCTKCGQCSLGQYGMWTDAEAMRDARNALAAFFKI